MAESIQNHSTELPFVYDPAIFDTFTPYWYQQINRQSTGKSGIFILHNNIHDLVVAPEYLASQTEQEQAPTSLRWSENDMWSVEEYIVQRALVHRKSIDLVIKYSHSAGIEYCLPKWPSTVNNEQYDLLINGLIKGAKENNYHNRQGFQYRYLPSEWAEQKQRASEDSGDFYFESLPEPRFALPLLERMLRLRKVVVKDREEEEIRLRKVDVEGSEEEEIRFILLIENLENLLPADSNQLNEQIVNNLETFHRWSRDPLIAENNHIIIMMTDNLRDVNARLYEAGSSIIPIEIPRPKEDDRRFFLHWLSTGDLLPKDTEQISFLANQTAGFNYHELYKLALYVRKNEKRINELDLVQSRKAELIQTQSGGILNVLKPTYGFEAVGGLDHILEDLNSIAKLMRTNPDSPVIPKAILMAGPPGTGKTLVARSLAFESRINLVTMEKIRSMWQGETEKNFDMVLNLSATLSPVIIFIDEFDQAFGRRATGREGDSGVSARLFGRLLEFMSNPSIRGKVLFILASNRPDLIDDAVISRLDKIYPFLLPDAAARASILLEKLPNGDIPMQWMGGVETVRESCEFQKAVEELEGFSGREIERVLREAIILSQDPVSTRELMEKYLSGQGENSQLPNVPSADLKGEKLTVGAIHLLLATKDFVHSHDIRMYAFQTLLAVRATNFNRFLPRNLEPFKRIGEEVQKHWQGRHFPLKPLVENNRLNRDVLDDYIHILEQKLSQGGRL